MAQRTGIWLLCTAASLAAALSALGWWLYAPVETDEPAVALIRLAAPAATLADAPLAAAIASTAPVAAAPLALLKLGRTRYGQAVAILSLDGAAARAFVVGDVVSPGLRLTRILSGSVELQHGLKFEHLALSANAQALASLAQKPVLALEEQSAQTTTSKLLEPSIIAHALDQPPPTGSPVERAIARAIGR